MRQYRGLRLSNKEWIYGYYWKEVFIRASYIKTLIEGGTIQRDFRVIPESVGQSTGLKDKNGVKVWEGDVIDLYGTIYIVRIDEPLAVWFESENDSCGLIDVEQAVFEIIGTIHTHPELLQKG
jgi:uncharacterized phage protein (TIGR01671 family)